tara:strand:+ start:74 stop:910 length:837 start_codon:yes stop_codon:yes gene_type:complete
MNEENLPFLNKGEVVMKSLKNTWYWNPTDEFDLLVATLEGTIVGNWYLTNHRLILETTKADWPSKQREGCLLDLEIKTIESIKASAGSWLSKPKIEIYTNSRKVKNPIRICPEEKDVKEWDGYFEKISVGGYSDERNSITTSECEKMVSEKDFETAIACSEQGGIDSTKYKKMYAEYCEDIMDINRAIEIYEELKEDDEVVRLRTFIKEESKVKVTQKVVHGDEVTKTEIKDSVVSKSNVGAGGKSKAEEIKEIKELLDSGAIDDDEFKQMKKEILGK